MIQKTMVSSHFRWILGARGHPKNNWKWYKNNVFFYNFIGSVRPGAIKKWLKTIENEVAAATSAWTNLLLSPLLNVSREDLNRKSFLKILSLLIRPLENWSGETSQTCGVWAAKRDLLGSKSSTRPCAHLVRTLCAVVFFPARRFRKKSPRRMKPGRISAPGSSIKW